MNIRQISWYMAIATVGWMPAVAVAEVSDKEPSIPLVLLLGILIGGGLFFLAWFRWWLGVLLSAIPTLLIVESISLWNETAMREALIHEQGWIYFGALIVQGVLMLTGVLTGVVVGYNHRKIQRRRKERRSENPV